MHVVINGELVLESEARILISDLSIQRGYGVFDFFRTANYQPIFVEDHLDRFFHSANKMHLDVDLNRQQLKEMIQQLIEKNNLPDSGIRITLTGGYSIDGYSIAKPNLLITQTPFAFNKDNFKKGIKLVTYPHQRQLPEVKTIDYLQAIYLQPLIKANNADDVLYHHQNEISECPRSNFFIVMENDEIITPYKNILKGITRKRILEFPEFNIKEAVISLQHLEKAKEAFISSTTKAVLPVLKIDDRTIGNDRPGIMTTKIYNKIIAIGKLL